MSLVLGIVGVTACPFIASVPALFMGWRARKLIRDSNGILRGQGRATAGIVLGIAGIVLGLALTSYVLVTAVDSFLRHQALQAERATLEQTLGNMATAQESLRATSGSYASDVDQLVREGFVEPPNVEVSILSATPNGFCLHARSREGRGAELYFSSASSFSETPC